jgi:hypothetical protein
MILLFSCSFLIHSNSSLGFAVKNKPSKETKAALEAFSKFRKNYYKLPYWKSSSIYAQDCLGFYLSDIYTIRSLKNRQQISDAKGNYFVILCDFAPGRWPIGDDYDPLKSQLRDEVQKGQIAEHKDYYPLLIFEKKYQ